MHMFSKWNAFIFIIIFSISSTVYSAQHKPIIHYTDLLTSLSQGNNVRAIITLNKCTLSGSLNADINDNIASMNFNNFNQYQIQMDGKIKNVIATSNTMLVQHHQFGMIFHYARLRLFSDDSAELYGQFLDPKTYSPLGEVMYHCRISHGDDHNGVELYQIS